MDGSDSIMRHWDHLHTLLSVVALLFAFIAMRATKQLKMLRNAGHETVTSASAQLAAVIPISAAKSSSTTKASQQSPSLVIPTVPPQQNDTKVSHSDSQDPEHHADIAQMLTLMQQQARLLDFVSEEITHFSDQQVGAVARMLHGGLQKIFQDYIQCAPIITPTSPDQETVQIAVSFDPRRIHLLGKIEHSGPYQGQLIHGGWQLNAVMLPKRGTDYQASVLQAAEVEV